MPAFSYIHLTDLHLCTEALRKNAPYLYKRPWNEIIDTLAEQSRELNYSSLFLPVSFDPDIAKGVAKFCFEWRDAADGIVITGDLATTGTTADVEVAKKFVESVAKESFVDVDRFPTIASSGLPIHVFAGNHDRYANEVGKPFSNHFDFVFEKYMDKKTSFTGSWFCEKEDTRLGFVYADFTLRNRVDASSLTITTSYGQGRIYDDVLRDLCEETLRMRREEGLRHVVWLIHFAPYECGNSLRLIDHQKLMDASKALGIEVIVCGHTHESLVKKFDSQTIFCGGSACCIDNVGGCKVHVLHFELEQTLSVSRSTYVWDDDSDEFVHLRDDS